MSPGLKTSTVGIFTMALLCTLAFVLQLSFNLLVFAEVHPHKDDFHKHEHFGANQQHDVRYDHEAFLGKDKRKFDELSPEESKERLG